MYIHETTKISAWLFGLPVFAYHLISWCLDLSMHSLGIGECLKEKLHVEF